METCVRAAICRTFETSLPTSKAIFPMSGQDRGPGFTVDKRTSIYSNARSRWTVDMNEAPLLNNGFRTCCGCINIHRAVFNSFVRGICFCNIWSLV